MPLNIGEVLTLDENLALSDDDVASLSPGVSAAITALSLNTASTGFHQVATQSGIASDDHLVTDYFLAADSSGALFTTGVATDFMVGSDQVFLFGTSDSDIVVGRIGNGASADAGGEVAFTIALDETVAGGLVTNVDLWMEMFTPMTHNGVDMTDALDTLDLSNLLYLSADYRTTATSTFRDFSAVPSGQDAFALIHKTDGSGTVDLLVTGFKGATVGTVNVSSTGLGSFSQAVDQHESLRFDIVSGGVFSKADSSSEVHDEANIDYGAHEMAVGASFELVQVNPNHKTATCSLFAFDAQDDYKGAGFNQDAIGSPGLARTIHVADVIILNAAGVDVTAAWASKITAIGVGVKIADLPDDYTVKFTTDDPFDRFIVTNDSLLSNRSFDLGNVTVTTMTTGVGHETVELGSHIVVEDDGPSVSASADLVPAVTVDESALATDGTGSFASLFTIAYGADGAGSTAYSLGLNSSNHDSGLVDTATGQAVTLSMVGDDVYGTNGDGDTVFVISVDASGTVTLDQQRAVVHSDADHSNFDEGAGLGAADLVTLTATAVDGEASGDHGSATRDIGDAFVFHDDGPGFGAVGNVTVDFTAAVDPLTGNVSFTADGGADGGHVTIGNYADLSSLGLSGTYNADHTVLTYSDGTNDIYRLTVTDSGYDFDVLHTITADPEALNFGALRSGSPQETLLVPTASGSYSVLFDGLLFAGQNGGAIGQQASEGFFAPYDLNAGPGDDLNPDNVGFGVKNGQASQINQNEGFFFSTSTGADQQSLTFDVAGIGNVAAINMEVWLYDDGGNLLDYYIDTVSGLKAGNVGVTIADGGHDIAGSGHDAGGESFDTAYVRFFFDSPTSTQGVRIIDFASTVAVAAPDRLIDFRLTNTDGDLDYTYSNTFTVNVDNPAYSGSVIHYDSLI